MYSPVHPPPRALAVFYTRLLDDFNARIAALEAKSSSEAAADESVEHTEQVRAFVGEYRFGFCALVPLFPCNYIHGALYVSNYEMKGWPILRRCHFEAPGNQILSRRIYSRNLHVRMQEASEMTPRKSDVVNYHGYYRHLIYSLHQGMCSHIC